MRFLAEFFPEFTDKFEEKELMKSSVKCCEK